MCICCEQKSRQTVPRFWTEGDIYLINISHSVFFVKNPMSYLRARTSADNKTVLDSQYCGILVFIFDEKY